MLEGLLAEFKIKIIHQGRHPAAHHPAPYDYKFQLNDMSRILYAIQGTGNGHLSRALDVCPCCKAVATQLDILVSGPPADLPLAL